MSTINEKKIIPRAISGFPEFLPEEVKIHQELIGKIQNTYEAYGFSRIETPAVELNEVLAAKGGMEKEIYTITRHQSTNDKESKSYSLKFDLTVPLARYVAQHSNKLAFPFRRYQIQPVWRGERPQDGRFREFLQCDIDVIGDGELSLNFDAEIPSIIYDIFNQLDIGEFNISISNRKILQGLFQCFGVHDGFCSNAFKIIDSIEKIGVKKAASELIARAGLSKPIVERLLEIIKIRGSSKESMEALNHIGIENDLFKKGVPEKAFTIDLAIVRGLDYYTGTVYETRLVNHPEIGSICSGGRYDNLASYFTDKKLPGVGISIGFTRLFSRLLKAGIITTNGSSPAHVLITKIDESHITDYLGLASMLRKKGIKTEMYLENKKLSSQLKYANKKGIPLVVIAGSTELDNDTVQLKHMKTGDQAMVTCDDLASKVNDHIEFLKRKGILRLV